MARRLRGRTAKAVALAVGIVAGLFFFAVGASILWSVLLGLAACAMTFATSFLAGGGRDGTNLEEGAGHEGLSGHDLGDV